MTQSAWRWESGKVDRSKEHLEITYGNADTGNPDTFLPVALIAAPIGDTFTIQFLIDPEDAKTRQIVDAVRRELDFYLVQKQEPNPWKYAQYHCSTASNVYSAVHWGYYPKGCKAQ